MHVTVVGPSSVCLHATLSLLLVVVTACGGGATPQQTSSATSSGGGTTVGSGGSAGGDPSTTATSGVGGGFGGSSGTTGGSGGSGGENPCVPPFDTAKPPPVCGGPHAGALTDGVSCGAQLCALDQGCCYSRTPGCGFNYCSVHADCDGPEDCTTPGQVCCVSPSPNAVSSKVSYYLGTVCVAKAACAGAGVPACTTSADCAAGESCCGTFTNYDTVHMGICHAGSCD